MHLEITQKLSEHMVQLIIIIRSWYVMPHITSNLRDDTYIPSTRGSWSTGAPKGSMSGYTRDSWHMVLPSNSAENDYYITSKSLLQAAPVHRHINTSMSILKLHSLT